jgi:23S rRNA (cytosine1962-C5)-methyltransferase
MLDDRGAVHVLRGRDRQIRQGHPWIFGGSIASVDGRVEAGDTVKVFADDGTLLGRGAFSPTSQIRVRMWTTDATLSVNQAFIDERLRVACALRERFVLSDSTDGARLVFGENDGLPGLIVDKYSDVIAIQPQSAGAERILPWVIDFVVKRYTPRAVVVRGDAEVRQLEGLAAEKRVVKGTLDAGPVLTRENDMLFHVDVIDGHKTGFYLDQRDSRALLRRCASGARVLNCFSYTGGFSVAAWLGGASQVVSVDASAPALELLKENVARNGHTAQDSDVMRGDCFDTLKALAEQKQQFDVVVLDPPKFAPSAHHLEKALRAYEDLAVKGLRVLAPGGLLFSYSCSGAVSAEAFDGAIAGACQKMRRTGRILHRPAHALCHPTSTTFPEGAYLKGVVVHVA